MYLKFQGWISGHGLNRAPSEVEMEPESPAGTVLFYRGRFLWPDAQFVVGQQYHLDLNDGRFYEFEVTDVTAGLPSMVKFQTD